ncbi:MAG: hypothetical protein HOM74_06200, partial [Proteobacteria bacterium]|nr:hypothetical protein [Pseudomonadota bacterium]
MKQRHCRLILLLMLLPLLLLTSCGPLPGELSRPEAAESTLLPEAESLAARGLYARAAELYRRNAKTSDQAAHYWLRATELMLLARGYAQATDDLAAITEDQLKPLVITRKRIAEAELALYAEDYIGIIQALAEQDSKNNLKAAQLRHAELLVAAYSALNKPLEQIKARAQLSKWLTSSAKTNNEQQLWQLLKTVDS